MSDTRTYAEKRKAIRMKERLTELLLRGKDKCLDTMCEECKYKDDENCGTSIIVDHLIANGVTVTIKKPPTDLSKKCGSCAYAKAEPDMFGRDCYVRCKNPEHLAKYCRSRDRSLRQRTNPACRQYKPKGE